MEQSQASVSSSSSLTENITHLAPLSSQEQRLQTLEVVLLEQRSIWIRSLDSSETRRCGEEDGRRVIFDGLEESSGVGHGRLALVHDCRATSKKWTVDDVGVSDDL